MGRYSLDKDKIKVLLLEGVAPSAVEEFNKAGYSNVEYLKGALDKEELLEKIKDVHFLGIRSRTFLTPDVFDAAKKLVAVGCFCIGTNQVDLKSATEHGIPVFNAPYSNTRSVAELVTGEYLLLLRRVPSKNAGTHAGKWDKNAAGCFEARGKTLGIVGYGHIGTQVGIIAEALGLKVIYHDIENKLSLGNAHQVGSLDELLAKADIVTMHVPETPETKNMISRDQFAKMKDGAIFLNASRGTVVDVEALAEAVESGHIAGAACDVHPVEPATNKDPFISPLQKFDNVILTPHIGASTKEAQTNIGIEVADKLVKYSDNGSTIMAVNFPEVSLPLQGNVNRLLHIHRNNPGIINKINNIFAEYGINVVSQYLQTSPQIGYVVLDVEKSDKSEEVLSKLREIEGTIKTRILL
ncbi:MAG: phosphoglycerate dehydrogenase [Succinivibrionaceae bacterium]|jgi:D-3-phosphoglycerate dehydrogenase|nr:phosphoglycerate dehydrogenase [Succinivibrionaceae bacterium]MBQ1426917.1 phosphoglycerate dehydrogenase [Succinivibrionaceae bacterium]